MSANPSPLVRWWRRLFSRRADAAESISSRPVRLASETSARPLPRRSERHGGIEPLEGRIAPAVLLPGGRDLSYTDLSGDKITVHLSSPIFAGKTGAELNTALDRVFVFSAGDAHSGDTTPQDLQRIDLELAPLTDSFVNKAMGLSLSVTVTTPAAGSSHLVNVGAIEATDVSLGSVYIQGDLGHLTAGSSSSPVAVQSLHLESLGKVRTSQAGTATYLSAITGGIGTLSIGTVNDARIDVRTAQSFGTPVAIGNIGSITLGHAGAPLGDVMIGGGTTDSASIIAAGNIGSIQVSGNLHGGDGDKSAAISCGGSIGSVAVAGKLLGGVGSLSGSIESGKAIGTVTLLNAGGNVLEGGAGKTSGYLLGGTGIGSVTIHGNIAGGAGEQSGQLLSNGNVNSVGMIGNLTGGDRGSVRTYRRGEYELGLDSRQRGGGRWRSVRSRPEQRNARIDFHRRRSHRRGRGAVRSYRRGQFRHGDDYRPGQRRCGDEQRHDRRRFRRSGHAWLAFHRQGPRRGRRPGLRGCGYHRRDRLRDRRSGSRHGDRDPGGEGEGKRRNRCQWEYRQRGAPGKSGGDRQYHRRASHYA